MKKHSIGYFPSGSESEASRNLNSMFNIYEKSQGVGEDLKKRLQEGYKTFLLKHELPSYIKISEQASNYIN